MAKWIDPEQQRKNRESNRKGSNKRVSGSYRLGRGEPRGKEERGSEPPLRGRERHPPQTGWRRVAVSVRPRRYYTEGTVTSPSYLVSDLDTALCAVAAQAGASRVMCVRLYTDDLNAWALAGRLRQLPWCHVVELDLTNEHAQLVLEVCYD